MAHSNAVLHQMLAEIPRHPFQKCVEAHSGDHRVRELSCWGRFTALPAGQFRPARRNHRRDLQGPLGNRLFFKALKQALKIKAFLGTSKNAVLTQVWMALIACLLLSYFRFRAKSGFSVLCLIRRLGRALFQRRDLTAWLLRQEPDLAPSPAPPNLPPALGL